MYIYRFRLNSDDYAVETKLMYFVNDLRLKLETSRRCLYILFDIKIEHDVVHGIILSVMTLKLTVGHYFFSYKLGPAFYILPDYIGILHARRFV